ncbi:MAG: Ig-like domain-containing protein [Gammaproteobacteria bacterium]
MARTIKGILIALLLTVVSACGGGGGFTGDGGGSGGGGGGGGGGGSGTNPGTTIKLGSGSGSGFTPGVLTLGINSISAGGTTGVTASLVDASNNLFTTATDINFSSNCLALGQASLTPATVNTVTGVANSNYKALGCSGSDVITATAIVDGVTLSATATVTVQPATLGSLVFDSAVPTNIALQGTGGSGRSETSIITFIVRDAAGNPFGGQAVQFVLNTSVGGLTLSPTSAISGSDGKVQTIVTAGTVATAVRVTATLVANGISTQSDLLIVSSGTADQNSFSLSAETLNPEAFNIDGVQVPITIRVADHFNNPVPDGTAVSFRTEGGSIGPSCTTVSGVCSVNWTSQNPRPSDGRVTILATAIGEESFTDTNGNGRKDAVSVALDPFTDLAEAFVDNNEDGTFNNGAEEFVDFNSNGTRDSADGFYNGILCTPEARASGQICDAPMTLNVREDLVIVMSGSTLNIQTTPSGAGLTVAAGTSLAIAISLSDARGQVPPSGTTITLTASGGLTLIDPTSFTVPSTNFNGAYVVNTIVQRPAGDPPGQGFLTITAVTPSGLVTTRTVTITKS